MLSSLGVNFMSHSILNFNQMAEWNHRYDTSTQENIDDYFDCLIECEDEQASCKRICREVLA